VVLEKEISWSPPGDFLLLLKTLEHTFSQIRALFEEQIGLFGRTPF
jgi:hypothetical protein